MNVLAGLAVVAVVAVAASNWKTQKPMFGKDWDAYFRSKYRDENVTWETKEGGSLVWEVVVRIQNLQNKLGMEKQV